MEVDENASGVIRLTAYDFGAFPPEPIAERLVYRRPRNRLRFEVSGQTLGLQPGSFADLSLLVRDERGEEYPAVLGVSVVDDAALSLARDTSASLTTHFWLTSQIRDVRGLEDANFVLEDDPPSAQALDLLLGTQGWRRFQAFPLDQFAAADTVNAFQYSTASSENALGSVMDESTAPQLLMDNAASAVTAVSGELESLYGTMETSLRHVGRVLFCGGLALLVSLLLLAVMRRATAPVWLPALGAGALCLVLGGVWMAASIDRRNPLAGAQTADSRVFEPLAKLDADFEALNRDASSGTQVEQRAAEEDMSLVDEARSQERPFAELSVMESEVAEEEPSTEFARTLGGNVMPAEPAPTDAPQAMPAPMAAPVTEEPVTEAPAVRTGQIAARKLDSRESARAESDAGAANLPALGDSPTPKIAEVPSAGSEGRPDASERKQRIAVPRNAPEVNDKLEASDAFEIPPSDTKPQMDFESPPTPQAVRGRIAGIGGKADGELAGAEAKANEERFLGEQAIESFAKDSMSRGQIVGPRQVLPPKEPGKKVEDLARETQQRGMGPEESKEVPAKAGAGLPASELGMSDDAVPPAAEVVGDRRKATRSAPAAAALRPQAAQAARKGKQADAQAGSSMTRQRQGAAASQFQPLVRRYADWKLTQARPDQTETVYWNPLLVADEGRAVPLRFRLSDAKTSYRLLINGHGGGRLGSYQTQLTTTSGDPADD
jgi:hypothetical protein